MEKALLAGDLDYPLPTVLLRVGGKILDEFEFHGTGCRLGVPGMEGHPADLIVGQGFLEALAYGPADIRSGHGL